MKERRPDSIGSKIKVFRSGYRTAEVWKRTETDYRVVCRSVKGVETVYIDNLGDAMLRAQILLSEAVMHDEAIVKQLSLPKGTPSLKEERENRLTQYVNELTKRERKYRIDRRYLDEEMRNREEGVKGWYITINDGCSKERARLRALQKIGRCTKEYVYAEKNRLGRVLRFFGKKTKLPDVTYERVAAFLDDVSDIEVTRIDYQNSVARVLSHYFHKEDNPAYKPYRKGVESKRSVFTSEELRRILNYEKISKNALMVAVLGGFMGIRKAEALRYLEKYKYDPLQTHVVLSCTITKSRRERIIEITPQVRAWFKYIESLPSTTPTSEAKPVIPTPQEIAKMKGCSVSVAKEYVKRMSRRLRSEYTFNEVRKIVKVPERPNGLRHSFVSYHVALVGDPIKTSLICGHSLSTLDRYYKTVLLPNGYGITREVAEEWFNILPPSTLVQSTPLLSNGTENTSSGETTSNPINSESTFPLNLPNQTILSAKGYSALGWQSDKALLSLPISSEVLGSTAEQADSTLRSSSETMSSSTTATLRGQRTQILDKLSLIDWERQEPKNNPDQPSE